MSKLSLSGIDFHTLNVMVSQHDKLNYVTSSMIVYRHSGVARVYGEFINSYVELQEFCGGFIDIVGMQGFIVSL